MILAAAWEEHWNICQRQVESIKNLNLAAPIDIISVDILFLISPMISWGRDMSLPSYSMVSRNDVVILVYDAVVFPAMTT
jgi:hypothetical protein